MCVDNGIQHVGEVCLFHDPDRARRGVALRAGLLSALLLLVLALPARAQYLGPLDAAGLHALVDAQRGKVVVLNFWATWCPPCRVEMPELTALRAAFDPRELFMVGVSLDYGPEAPARFALTDNPGYPLYLAEDDVLAAFKVGAIPRTMIWAPDGTRAEDHVGVLDRRALAGTVSRLLGRAAQ